MYSTVPDTMWVFTLITWTVLLGQVGPQCVPSNISDCKDDYRINLMLNPFLWPISTKSVCNVNPLFPLCKMCSTTDTHLIPCAYYLRLSVCVCQSFSRRWIPRWTAPRSCVSMSSRILGTFPAAFRPSRRPSLNMLKVREQSELSRTGLTQTHLHITYIWPLSQCSEPKASSAIKWSWKGNVRLAWEVH